MHDFVFIEALRKRKKNTFGQHSCIAWPKCDRGQFLESLTPNCVCWAFSFLLSGSEVAWRAVDPPKLSLIHGELLVLMSLLMMLITTTKSILATDSTKDMHDE